MNTYLLVMTCYMAHNSFVINADVAVPSMTIEIVRLAEADATKHYRCERCVVTNIIKLD